MKLKVMLLGLVVIGGTTLMTHSVWSQDAAKAKDREHAGDGMPDMEAMFEAMEKHGAPGEQHRKLAEAVGSYDVASKFWMTPELPPQEGRATAKIEMILGGRYMKETYKGDFMGKSFEGLLIQGYNNLTKKYESLWIDSMGTGFSLQEGKEQPNGDIHFKGTMRDAFTPDGRPYRSVAKHGDGGSFSFEMYDTLPDGTEFKNMELHYTKK